MNTNQLDVLSQLRAAFPAVPIPFADALTGGVDDNTYRERVDGKTWEQLDKHYVLKRSDALSFLAPKHLVSVLPVYLRSLVEDGTRTPVPDTLLLVLNRKRDTRFHETFDILDDAQRGAVIAVLELFAVTEAGQPADAARAASDRWKREVLKGG